MKQVVITVENQKQADKVVKVLGRAEENGRLDFAFGCQVTEAIDHEAAAANLADRVLDLTKQRDSVYAALWGLFEHCAMIHKVWGDGSNQKQADAAIAAGRAALAKVNSLQ